MMETKLRASVAILLLVGLTKSVGGADDLTAVETSDIRSEDRTALKNDRDPDPPDPDPDPNRARSNKYSSKIVDDRYRPSTELPFGYRTVSLNRRKAWKNGTVDDGSRSPSSTTETVLDFRIRKGTDFRENEIGSDEKGASKKDMATAGSSDGKQKKEVKKDDDDEEKTLSQQVADGKYGLIQNEIFADGSKRPGILSYLPNKEVPKDTKENFGGLEKDEIWLAEDHVLVLRGGRYPEKHENESPSSSFWPPIDDYEAPSRQVKIPKNPKIPPPFPVRLKEDGPLEFVGGENSTSGLPPFFPPFPPPFPFPGPNGTFSFPFPIPGSPDENPNRTLPFPLPPGPLPPFLANFPPGAAFLPPPGNVTDFDEDDPSVYYPPKYDFYYPKENATAVPPGPLVPGIILPPPPDFFAPLEEDERNGERDEDNETGNEAETATRPPFVGPNYLPVAAKPPFRERTSAGRFSTTTTTTTTPSPKQAVTYVYPENIEHERTPPSPLDSFKTTKVASYGSVPDRFSSPIYVPDGADGVVYHPLPTTSPKPNHITIPTTKSLSKEIYIVTTPEADVRNRIEDSFKKYKGAKSEGYEVPRPEIHPLRSLVKPHVSVSYVGKYGHLPPSTPFPFPKTQKPVEDDEAGRIRGGHYITHAPNFLEHVITTPATETNEITVTSVPVVKKFKIRPTSEGISDPATPSPAPPKATFYFYEERPATSSPVGDPEQITRTPADSVRVSDNEATPPIKYRYPSASSAKTPIRQYLEETFHSSNVLPNKPGASHASVFKHGHRPRDRPEMKHLDYGPPVTAKPVVKYHYVRNGDQADLSRFKINALQVENSGTSGLQTVGPTRDAPDPVAFSVAQLFTSTGRPEIRGQSVSTVPVTTTTTSTQSPIIYTNQDGPFVPSDYYVTARPDHVRYTPQDHSLMDDITKNYFTVFGQKINVQSTTPSTPYRRPALVPAKENPVPEFRPPPRPIGPSFPSFDKPKFVQIVTQAPRPHSHSDFEQYLKEITGEDQKDFIVTPNKIKKGKGFPTGEIPRPYRPPTPIFLQPVGQNYFRTPTPIPPVKTRQRPPSKYYYRGFADPSSYVYRPSVSTTLRPVVDVEIRPQYVQHVSSTVGPFGSVGRPTEKVPFDHDFGQYLREITGFTSPSTANPVKIKTDPDHFSTTPSPGNQIDYSPSRYPAPEIPPKPVSLEGDILVNYKPQRPEINPDAETVLPHTVPTYPTGSNFRIVDPPDLTLHRPRPPPPPLPSPSYDQKPRDFERAKDFFQNIPKSGYFSPSHPSASNSFISYNLPGNGGHFYFLTPQIAEKSDDDEEDERESQEEEYRTVNRQRKGSDFRYPNQVQQNPRRSYSNQDYLRRRRKKP